MGPVPYQPQTMSATKHDHIGHKVYHIGHYHISDKPCRPQSMTILATRYTISATTISATNHVGHKAWPYWPQGMPYRPLPYRLQTISATRYTRWVLSYGAFVCIPVVPGARCSARLWRKESALKSVEDCVHGEAENARHERAGLENTTQTGHWWTVELWNGERVKRRANLPS